MNRNQSIFRRTIPAIGTFVLLTAVFGAVSWHEPTNVSANPAAEPLVSPTVTPNPSPTCGVATVTYFSYVRENPEPIIVGDRQTNDPGSEPGLGSLYPSIAPAPTPADVPAPESCIFYPPKVIFTVESERPDDLDILLIDPNGNRSIVISDGGGSTPLNNIEYIIGAPVGAGTFPDETFPPAGFYTAANYPGLAVTEPGGQDNFPGVSGLSNYPTNFSSFQPWMSGAWKLYVVDDETGSVSSLPNGWYVRLDGECVTPPTICPPSPTPTPSPPLACGAGAQDRSFGNTGVVTTNMGSDPDDIRGIALDVHGKIVAAGISGSDTALARYNSDGSLDASFGTGGKVVMNIGTNVDSAADVVIQADEKIVIAGSSVNPGTVHDFTLARLNTNGTFDNSFGNGGIVTTPFSLNNSDEAYALAIQPDGKLVAAGHTWNGSNTDIAVGRYNTDGTLDSSFGVGGKVITAFGSDGDIATSTLIQPDGRIVVGGYSIFAFLQRFALVRYNADGTLDPTFGVGGKVSTPIGNGHSKLWSLSLQPDGKIVAAGSFGDGQSVSFDFALARYNVDGSLDHSFGNGGIVTTEVGTDSSISDVKLQPDGKIVVVGSASNGPTYRDFAALRYNPDGTVDTSFGIDGLVLTTIGFNDHARALAIQDDGKIIAGGRADADFAMIRYHATDPCGQPTPSPTPTPTPSPTPSPTPFILSEGFGTVTNGVPAVGWVSKNNSSPIGSQPTWFQGDAAVFPAVGGAPSSYIAGNFNLVAGRNTISNWLITPEIPLANGGMVNFWTRSVGSRYADRMQVRMSTAGASTNVGDTNTSVGDFTNLLMDINPTLWPAWYPTVWTEQRIVISGLPAPTTGRLAFRYFVADSGPFGSNGDYVGIDSFQYRLDTCPACATPTPPPTATPPPTPTPSPTTLPCPCPSPTPGVPQLDLGISQVDAPDPVIVGSQLTYSVTVTLSTNVMAAFVSPVVRFGFPSGMPLGFIRASATNGYTGSVDATGVTFTGGNIFAQGLSMSTATFTIHVIPYAAGTVISEGGKVVVDPDNWIAEMSETNNTAQTVTTSVRRALFDYDGDGRTDHSVFRPSNGTWYLERSTARFESFQLGNTSDKLAPADYDGDGKADIATYRTGQWLVMNSASGTFSLSYFGVGEDRPVPGDYDGDGKVDLTVFRPSQGIWYRQDSSNGAFSAVQFGTNGDVPTVGDFDGDGKNDIGVFRAAGGEWYNLRSSDGSVFAQQFGQSGDKIAPADYDGDGKTDIAIYRASSGLWVVRNSATGTYSYYVFGAVSDVPVPGDYDGDGKADIAVWRPGNGTWYVQRSSNGEFMVFQWGQDGDRPTPGAFGN